MGLVIAILAIIALISWLISRAVYKVQARNNYKSPKVTAVLIFLLSFALITAAIYFLIINNINMSRR